MDYITLNNGLKMPIVGFGTMNIFDLDECTKVLKDAYEVGYRCLIVLKSMVMKKLSDKH